MIAPHTHELVRATIIPVIVNILSSYYSIPPQEAFRRFYESKTEKCLADDETGLYGQSALYLAAMFIREQDGEDNIDEQRLNIATKNSNFAS